MILKGETGYKVTWTRHARSCEVLVKRGTGAQLRGPRCRRDVLEFYRERGGGRMHSLKGKKKLQCPSQICTWFRSCLSQTGSKPRYIFATAGPTGGSWVRRPCADVKDMCSGPKKSSINRGNSGGNSGGIRRNSGVLSGNSLFCGLHVHWFLHSRRCQSPGGSYPFIILKGETG